MSSATDGQQLSEHIHSHTSDGNHLNRVRLPGNMRAVPLVGLALALAVVGLILRRNGAAGPAQSAASRPDRRPKKTRAPRSLVRYYGIGLLIGALERDSTRKAVIAMLRLVQQRM